ncbi:helicase [Azospirillum brasilense]|uniref:helicase-related protein n=1 Tax=Azospirillum brasilense TaxID=192 RepID=UPI00190DE969|nr:helicase-related protein [Azospirillum brasilense]MBK3735554.1 helicase [Azospirillum brasilense]
MTDAYADLLARKAVAAPLRGLEDIPELPSSLSDLQRDVTTFLLRAGRGAGFLDTGLGKTRIQLAWARIVADFTGLPVLGFVPLAVGPQHVREAESAGIPDVSVVRCQDEIRPGVNLTNYERMHLFSPVGLGGCFLDESSILKSFSGTTTRKLMAFAAGMRFRAAFTATPAPNDHTELGQHSQFLGVMDSNEMLSRWFIADQKQMGAYRLKKHGVRPFWSWTASWARCASRPSDLGYSDAGYEMPDLIAHDLLVKADLTVDAGEGKDGQLRLFRMPGANATAIHAEKRRTAEARAAALAEVVMDLRHEAWNLWCDTDYEADALTAAISDAVEVRGSMSPDLKEERLEAFGRGDIRVLVTKPRIAGFGLNWQHVAHCGFAGPSYSYEQRYQAIRRNWRFGQRRPVQVYTAYASTEQPVLEVLRRKAADHEVMKAAMAEAMSRAADPRSVKHSYAPTVAAALPAWLTGAMEAAHA